MAKKKQMAKEVAKLFEPVSKEKFYEMVVVIKPYLPEHVRRKSENKIEDILKRFNATVKAKAYWGKRVLAYKIAGQKEGYYIIYHFQAPTESLQNIRKYLDKHAELLRYLILQMQDTSWDKLKLLVKKAVVLE